MNVTMLEHKDTIIVNIESALPDREMIMLKNIIIEKVNNHRTRGVILNAVGLDVVDSFTTRILEDINRHLDNMGKLMVAVNLKPDVLFTIKRFGLDHFCLQTADGFNEGISLVDNYKSTQP